MTYPLHINFSAIMDGLELGLAAAEETSTDTEIKRIKYAIKMLALYQPPVYGPPSARMAEHFAKYGTE